MICHHRKYRNLFFSSRSLPLACVDPAYRRRRRLHAGYIVATIYTPTHSPRKNTSVRCLVPVFRSVEHEPITAKIRWVWINLIGHEKSSQSQAVFPVKVQISKVQSAVVQSVHAAAEEPQWQCCSCLVIVSSENYNFAREPCQKTAFEISRTKERMLV